MIDALIEVDERAGFPQLLLNGLAWDDVTGLAHEELQQLQGLRLQPHQRSMLAQLAVPDVELEGSETACRGTPVGHTRGRMCHTHILALGDEPTHDSSPFRRMLEAPPSRRRSLPQRGSRRLPRSVGTDQATVKLG